MRNFKHYDVEVPKCTCKAHNYNVLCPYSTSVEIGTLLAMEKETELYTPVESMKPDIYLGHETEGTATSD